MKNAKYNEILLEIYSYQLIKGKYYKFYVKIFFNMPLFTPLTKFSRKWSLRTARQSVLLYIFYSRNKNYKISKINIVFYVFLSLLFNQHFPKFVKETRQRWFLFFNFLQIYFTKRVTGWYFDVYGIVFKWKNKKIGRSGSQ